MPIRRVRVPIAADSSREARQTRGDSGHHHSPIMPIVVGVRHSFRCKDESAIVFLVVRCECGKESQTRVENAGRRARCPGCQREFIVPEPTSPPDLQFGPLQDFSPPKTSGKAIASVLLGISSVFACLFTGLPAILFGILALADIVNPRKHVGGMGLAITGIVLGSVASSIWLSLPAWSGPGPAASRAQCTNNLKQIALAMHNYESEYGCFSTVRDVRRERQAALELARPDPSVLGTGRPLSPVPAGRALEQPP